MNELNHIHMNEQEIKDTLRDAMLHEVRLELAWTRQASQRKEAHVSHDELQTRRGDTEAGSVRWLAPPRTAREWQGQAVRDISGEVLSAYLRRH